MKLNLKVQKFLLWLLKFKFYRIEATEAQLGWVFDVDIRYPVRTQCTYVSERYESPKKCLSHNFVIGFLKFYFVLRKQVTYLQKRPGEWEISY